MSPNQCNCPVGTAGPSLATSCGGGAYLLFMSLLEAYLNTQCDIADPCGRTTSRYRSEPDSKYDFIVVGSGSAGSVVASRLSEESKWKVLLIEAGDEEPIGTQVPSLSLNYFGSDLDWKYQTEPEKVACLGNTEQRCSWPRGKVLGGTSVINGMMYMRGSPEDYDHWRDLGNTGWSFKDVLPYFLKSENNLQLNEVDNTLHASGGLMPVSHFPYNPPLSYAILKGGEELGYAVQDLNGRNATGFMIGQMTSRNGIRYSSSRAFLRPARDRKNLHIMLNTTATKILFKRNSKTVEGVEVIGLNGKTHKIYANKEVIVSGGAINSPQLLLLSGIGPAEELKKVNIKPVHNLPGVGKNLHNHVAYFTTFNINETNTALLDWPTINEYLLHRNGLLSGTGIGDVTAKIFTRYAENPKVPDVQLFFSGYSPSCSQTGQVGEVVSNSSRTISIFPAVLQPRSRGSITLASNDPLAKPLIVANYLSEEHDVKTLIEAIKFTVKLSETPTLKQFGVSLDRTVVSGCEAFTFGTDDYWECAVRQRTGPENHQAGSCKMGPASDPLAVVDHELRVHGVKGLRVMDTSIMPKVVSGNTHAPAVMIAEKGVDMIKRSHGGLISTVLGVVKSIFKLIA